MRKTIILLLFTIYSFGQTTGEISSKKRISIQYIQIKDKPLLLYLEKYIDKFENKNELFRKGLGFVVLNNINYSMESGRPIGRTMLDSADNYKNQSHISISIQVYPLFLKNRIDCINCNYFPPYYTIISNKLVLIYEDNVFGLNGRKYANDTHNSSYYKKRSLKKMSKLVENMAIINLPSDYVFDDFLEKDMKFSTLKEKAKNKDDILKFYEFINFKANEEIFFYAKKNMWLKIK